MEIKRDEYEAMLHTICKFFLIKNYLMDCGDYVDKSTLIYLCGLKKGDTKNETEEHKG